jgi:hypothetical protein
MIKIDNNENYALPNNFTGKDIAVQLSFRLSDDGINYGNPLECLGFLNEENDVKELVEFFTEDYKEFGYSDVQLVSIYIEVNSLNELKKVKN